MVYFCDIINENFNQILLKINKRKRNTFASFQINALNKFFTKLNKNECDYIDE